MKLGMSTALIAVVVFILAVAAKVAISLLAKEAEARILVIPQLLVRVAGWLLPRAQRHKHVQVWTAELHHVTVGLDGLPITRLARGIRFALGVVRAAPRIATAPAKGLLGRGVYVIYQTNTGLMTFFLISMLIGLANTRAADIPTVVTVVAFFISAPAASITAGRLAAVRVANNSGGPLLPLMVAWSVFTELAACAAFIGLSAVGSAGYRASGFAVAVTAACAALVAVLSGAVVLLIIRARRGLTAAEQVRDLLSAVAPSSALTSVFFALTASWISTDGGRSAVVSISVIAGLLSALVATLGAVTSDAGAELSLPMIMVLLFATTAGSLPLFASLATITGTYDSGWLYWAIPLIVAYLAVFLFIGKIRSVVTAALSVQTRP
ncbi:hypothetical protein ACFWUU_05345 [Kribbella sp. NPDC058693]|uniref:hypothetical protein n=1 Tax=Kribbella sp. NPDC058693 TaxID=3346602 RepID=UPI00365FC659